MASKVRVGCWVNLPLVRQPQECVALLANDLELANEELRGLRRFVERR
jgi:hypothetical protein